MVNWMDYKNYRVHGFRDGRWLIHDRVGLYKRMIALRSRDLDVLQYNFEKEVTGAAKSLVHLKKDTTIKRQDKRNALLGNRNMIYSTFCKHINLLLAYGKFPPDEIVAKLDQLNFNKRKTLDKYKFEKKKVMEMYKMHVLRVSTLEDRILMTQGGGAVKDERRIQELSNLIQAWRIRRNGAITIQTTYTGMLRILGKDALFYNAVVDTLDANCVEQSRLILDALEMGQTVREYLSDLTNEVADLELLMKINIVIRKKSLELFYARVVYFSTRLKLLARAEGDILPPVDHNPPKSRSHTQLLGEIQFIEKTLTQLQHDTLNPTLESIMPSYEYQMFQYLRLMKFRDVVLDYKKKLLRIIAHGKILLNLVNHTYNSEKVEYLEEKRNMLKKINKQFQRDEDLTNYSKSNSRLNLRIRNSMRNLTKILKFVEKRGRPTLKDSETILIMDVTGETSLELVPKKLTGNPKVHFTTVLVKDDAEYMLGYNLDKMRILMELVDDAPPSKLRHALLFRSNATMQLVTPEQREEEIDLCAGMIFEEKGILNYRTAKIESAIYVADNTVDELAVVAEQLKAMTKVRNPWVMAEMKALRKKRKERLKLDNKLRGIVD